MTLFDNGAASIGIIGGADGPTAIFLTGGSLILPLAALAVIMAAAAVLVWIFRRR